MKRQILFRGMSIRGEWSEGYYTHIIRDTAFKGAKEGHYISNSVGMPFAFQVRPETVGQFTGIQDAKGTKIFEGDVLKDTEGNIGVVVWIEEWAMFGTLLDYEYPAYVQKQVLALDESMFWSFQIEGDKSEIIGNIHENKELLTSKQ